ncbi:MAG: hypothetical protein U5K74_00135 [Gemmatimonadaceae bacterium]|nr:hypothetical protein [Gemmatimonadaceae bacterium]
MHIRTMTAAAFAVVALAACQKPADVPAAIDSTTPANATPTVEPVDSTLKADSSTVKADSSRPVLDSTAPAK